MFDTPDLVKQNQLNNFNGLAQRDYEIECKQLRTQNEKLTSENENLNKENKELKAAIVRMALTMR